jgi:hypothetical protein
MTQHATDHHPFPATQAIGPPPVPYTPRTIYLSSDGGLRRTARMHPPPFPHTHTQNHSGRTCRCVIFSGSKSALLNTPFTSSS